MSLSETRLRELAREATAIGNSGDGGVAHAVAASDVVAYLDSDDRNVRVAALRVLAFLDGEDAIGGILRGLDDPVKRVREVAAKSSVRFVDDARVVARLKQAVKDDESGSARPALQILMGVYASPYGLSRFEPVAEALDALALVPKHRQQLLFALLRSKALTAETDRILRDLVTHGSKDEAVMATRRLCGFRVARREELSPDQLRGAERAFGDVWYWVSVADQSS